MSNPPYPVYHVGAGGHAGANILFGAMALAALFFCIKVARRRAEIWPVAVFGGSMLLVTYEPFNNALAHCAYPAGGATSVTYLGQHVPVSTWFIYMFYFSVAVPLLMERLEQGITMRTLWKYYAVAVAICAAFEPLFANAHLGIRWWYYWGDNQALNFTGMPMFWWFANAMVVCATAMIFHLLRTHVLRRDRETWAFVVLEPLILFGVHGSASIPVFIAVTSSDSKALSTLATLATIALSFFYMFLLGRATTVSEPATVEAPARVPERTLVPA